MFFILSKLLIFLLKPVIWIIGLLVWGLLTRSVRRRKRLVLGALVLLVLLTNKMVFNVFIGLWEPEPLLMSEIEEPYDIGILLGGYSTFNIRPYADRQNFNSRANRFNNALELYGKEKIEKLLLTGGSAALYRNKPSEAKATYQYLRELEIPDSNLIVEPDSRNTYENARNTAELIRQRHPGARCLLITSAFHMRRAKACFDKVGLPVDTFPVDYLREQARWTPDYWLQPDAQRLVFWEMLIKEWVGMAAYWVRGYL